MAKREPTWGECKAFTFKTREAWRAEAARIRDNPKARGQHNTIYCNHITEQISDGFPISSLTQATVTQLVLDLEEEKEWVGPSSPNHIIQTILTVVNHCYDHGFIDKKPFKKLVKRRKAEHRTTFFTIEQLRQVAQAAIDPYRMEALSDNIWMLGGTGMRLGELFKLTAEDIDLDTRRIHIGGRPGFVTKGKNYRWITLIDPLIPILEKRFEYRRENVPLFANDFGSVTSLRRAFNKVRDYCGFPPRYSFHALRRGFASILAELGVPDSQIQDMMGHANFETTRNYIQVADKSKVQAIDKLNDYLKHGDQPRPEKPLEQDLYAQLKQQNDNLQAQLNALVALLGQQNVGSSNVERVA